MKFGIFYELQLPRPWTAGQRVPAAARTRSTRSSSPTGSATTTPGRSSTTSSRSTRTRSAPEVFLGAASQRTKNIRLGHGIIQLTTNHPRASPSGSRRSTCCRDGRVEFGMGEGAGADRAASVRRALARQARGVGGGGARHHPDVHATTAGSIHGKYFDFPLRNVLPKPLQKPHPPLWVACSQLRHHRRCRPVGHGRARLPVRLADAAHAWVHALLQRLLQRPKRLADYATNPNIALVSGFMCAPTDEEAIEAAPGWTFFQFALRYYGAARRSTRPAPVNLWDEYKKWTADRQGEAGAAQRPDRLAGDASARKLRQFEDVAHRPGDPAQPGRQAPRHEDICDSLELFAREVMPEFHAATAGAGGLEGRRARWPGRAGGTGDRDATTSTRIRTRTSCGSRRSSSSSAWRRRRGRRRAPDTPCHCEFTPAAADPP